MSMYLIFKPKDHKKANEIGSLLYYLKKTMGVDVEMAYVVITKVEQDLSSIMRELDGVLITPTASSKPPIVKVETNLEKIAEVTAYFMSLERLSTFKVISRRKVKTLPFNSDDLNRIVASKILSTSDATFSPAFNASFFA